MTLIDDPLAARLIATQFPQWKDLTVRAVAKSGWDNRTFHLGEEMLIRMPSDEAYAGQIEKEQEWLPKLAPFLPLSIPEPLAIGEPDFGYPFRWSIYRWLKGETASLKNIDDLSEFAISLAHFLTALQEIDTTGGPLPGPHSFWRGGALSTYNEETLAAISALKGKINVDAATKIWETALATSWQKPPVWVHGDISAGNLLVQDGRLCSVIDFGQLVVGDPACDLAIAWTLFEGKSREAFRTHLSLDSDTWARGKAWTLWKVLIVAAGLTDPGNTESAQCWRILEELL